MKINFSKSELAEHGQPEIDGFSSEGVNRIKAKKFGKENRWSIVLCRGKKVLIEDTKMLDYLGFPSIIWSGELSNLQQELEMLKRVDDNDGFK